MSQAEILESHRQFLAAWGFFAQHSRKGERVDLPEVHIASANVAWPIVNAAFLPAPVETEQALERAAAAAAHYFNSRGLAWMFAVCEDWLSPALRARAGALLAPHGLKPGMEVTGMVTEHLVEPVRPLPPLDFRQATDEQGRHHIADINARSYDAPRELGREALGVPAYYAGKALGFVGHLQGEPTSCATVVPLDGVAYVAWVATQPEYRKQGCAEAVMRHGLAEAHRTWGVRRTVLHATAAGYPVYLRMGYRPVTRFHLYMAAPQGK
jgi:GNAT superfamily N-acetyltransferase